MKTSWGSRIASTFALAPLLGACGSPPPPEPPPPPPPPSATAPIASAPLAPPPPPAPAPKLGAFIAMGDGTGPSHPIHADRHFARTSTFMLVAADLTPEYGNPACPISAPSCTVMAIAKFGAPLSVTDRLGGVEPSAAPAFGKIVPSDVNVFDLSGGQDVVYAASLKDGKLAIFKVGEDMKATLFAEDTHELNWQQAEVIETADGHVVIGVVRNEGPDQLVVAHIEDRGGKKMLGPLLRLPYGMVPKFRQSAQGARYPESEGMQPVWDFHATPLLDASGKVDKSWALAIMQVNPPPFSWKAGKPYKKPVEKGAKHGCGGPGSRSLSDKSVEKIVKVLRFDGAKLVSEHAVDRPQTRDLLSEPFDSHPALDGGVEVDGTVWGKEGKQSGAKGKVKKTPLPTILETVEMVNPGWHRTATFDPETKEGLMAWTGEGGFIRRFDADGKPKGPVETLTNFGQGTPYKVKGEWLNLDSHVATWLTGPHAGKQGMWNYQIGSARDVKFTDDKLSVFVWTNRSCGLLPLDLESLASGKLEPFAACDGNFFVSTPVKLPSGKMGIARTTNRGAVADVATLDGDATPLPDETTPPGKHVSSTMHKVWNDVVIVRRGTEGMTATWVSAGKTITGIPLPPKPDAKRGSERINGGPVIDGDLLLPDEPGMPVVVPEFAEAAKKGCTGYSVAGRHKGVISCLEASDPVKPGLVPGLRWFSY